MDLRNNLEGKNDLGQVNERRKRIENELGLDLKALNIDANVLGMANQKNCEQMFGHIKVPVGLAGPLNITFSSGEQREVLLPLATTEGALVASVNRGSKATFKSGIVTIANHVGITRSIALQTKNTAKLIDDLERMETGWKKAAEQTSHHVKLIAFETDDIEDIVFVTLYYDTDLAMGMNMATLASEAAGRWIAENCEAAFILAAANVDSDKKPSLRSAKRGRGYTVFAQCHIDNDVLESVLKTTSGRFFEAARVKLDLGSSIAGLIGANCHAANIVAALYLATGQDIAHVVEGSLAETSVTIGDAGVQIEVRAPAILVGVLGGGTLLPSQAAAKSIILKEETALKPVKQLAETIGAAILAGETSLLAALSSEHLGSAHKGLGR